MALLEKYRIERPGLEMHMEKFGSGEKLLKSITAGSAFDLLLLDILMPGLCGIELAREIRRFGDDSAIVFLTSSKKHALDAYSVSATQYILKPITEINLFPVLDDVIPTLKQRKERFFLLSTPERDVKMPFSSIIYVELDNRRLCVCLDNGSILYSKYLRTIFAEAVAPLLQDKRFLCPHKSFVLNVEKVEGLDKDAFIMKNDIQVPVSRFRYNEAKEAYFSYIADSHAEHGFGRGVPE